MSETSVESFHLLTALRQARGLLASGWAQDFFARDCDGHFTDYANPKACAWCVIGAVYRVVGEVSNSGPKAERTFLALGFSGWPAAARWNDTEGRTKEEVLARFDEAIARLEGRAP